MTKNKYFIDYLKLFSIFILIGTNSEEFYNTRNVSTSTGLSSNLIDVQRVEILNFPQDIVKLNSDVNFIIKKNNIQGSFEVKVNILSNTFFKVKLEKKNN